MAPLRHVRSPPRHSLHRRECRRADHRQATDNDACTPQAGKNGVSGRRLFGRRDIRSRRIAGRALIVFFCTLLARCCQLSAGIVRGGNGTGSCSTETCVSLIRRLNNLDWGWVTRCAICNREFRCVAKPRRDDVTSQFPPFCFC